ncbi:MAG TPA: hydroxymethylglutaryl-CoA reductase, degradative [Myxococcota bacterium]|nr:hydroxymethylglutaryl-CoA reductase, degradative [Myxococcota bacterium]
MKNHERWSRLASFFKLSVKDRRKTLLSLPVDLTEEDFALLDRGLSLFDAERMSENVIATFALPFSVAANFVVDEKPVLVPMVTEEPSIVAGCSKMAKLVSKSGGFFTSVDRALIKGQIQIYGLRDVDKALVDFRRHKQDLLDFSRSLCVNMQKRGGGIVDIDVRILSSQALGPMMVIEPVMDVVDAMGANAVNTVVEELAHTVSRMIDGKIGLKILSNLCDRRLARARCSIPIKHLGGYDPSEGNTIAESLIAGHALAECDIYRAATHNKGILNGIDAVALATGNDFRAIEAGAHAFAALNTAYRPLTSLSLNDSMEAISCELTLPLAVGVVGGIAHLHHGVKLSRKLLGEFGTTARGLASVMASVGLCQSLAALFALATEGIQKGHMKLHQKKLGLSL